MARNQPGSKSGGVKPKRYDVVSRTRKIPDFILDQVLGEKKVNSGARTKTGDRRDILAKSAIKQGRKDPGMKNPRGGRNMSADMRQQLFARPGGIPQEGPTDDVAKNVIERIMRAEKKRDFSREEVLKKVAEEEAKKKASKKKKGLAAIRDDDDDDDDE